MIHVIAVITAKPGMRGAVLREFRANMPAVHAERGCIEYAPAVDAEGMGFQTPFGPAPSSPSRSGKAPRRSRRTRPPRT